MSSFSYTHKVHEQGVVEASVTFDFWWDSEKVMIYVPMWVEVTFKNWDEAKLCCERLRQCDLVDQVGLADPWILNVKVLTLDGYAQALGVVGVKGSPEALRRDVQDGVQSFVTMRRLTSAHTLMCMMSLIPAMPVDQDQDVSLWSDATDDQVVVIVIQGREVRHFSLGSRNEANHPVRAVRWDKLDLLEMLSTPLTIEEA